MTSYQSASKKHMTGWFKQIQITESFANHIADVSTGILGFSKEEISDRVSLSFEESLVKYKERELEKQRINLKQVLLNLKKKTEFSNVVVSCVQGLVLRRNIPNYTLHIDLSLETEMDDEWVSVTVKSSKIDFQSLTVSDIELYENNLKNLLSNGDGFRVRVDSYLDREAQNIIYERDDGDFILASALIVSCIKNEISLNSRPIHVINVHGEKDNQITDAESSSATLEARLSQLQEKVERDERIWELANMSFDNTAILECIEELEKIKETSKTRNVIFIGRTGSGKSDTLNRIYHILNKKKLDTFEGGPLKVTGIGSCTSRITKLWPGKGIISLWDTPGLADQFGRDALFHQKLNRRINEAESVSLVIMMTKNMGYIDKDEKELWERYSDLLPGDQPGRILIVSTRDFYTSQERILAKYNAQQRMKELGFEVKTEDMFYCNFKESDGVRQMYELAETIASKSREDPFAVGTLARLQSVLERVKRLQYDVGARVKLGRQLKAESKRYLLLKLREYAVYYDMDVDAGFNANRQHRIVWKFRPKGSAFDFRKRAEYRVVLPKSNTTLEFFRKLLDLRELLIANPFLCANRIVEAGYIVIQWPDWVQTKEVVKGALGQYSIETDFAIDLEDGLTKEQEHLIKGITRGSIDRIEAAEEYDKLVDHKKSIKKWMNEAGKLRDLQ